MKSVKDKTINEIIINKSKFITVITNLNDKNDVQKIIEEYKKKYKDATHYCYAYIINNHQKCSDDGEPGGTAGMPILNVLQNNELTNVLCIVIRYFGGIKLGAGGLVRAYSRSASEAINKSTITTLIKGFNIKIEFDYDNIKPIDYILKNYNIKKEFENKVTYSFDIKEEELKEIENLLKEKAKIISKEARLLTV